MQLFSALRHPNGTYFLNGPNDVGKKHETHLAGTTFAYRRQDGQNLEFVSAKGPLSHPVDIALLYNQPNPGVKYEYMIPADHAAALPVVVPVDRPFVVQAQNDETRNHHHGTRRLRRRKFVWKIIGMTECSRTCGGGERDASTSFLSRSDVVFSSRNAIPESGVHQGDDADDGAGETVRRHRETVQPHDQLQPAAVSDIDAHDDAYARQIFLGRHVERLFGYVRTRRADARSRLHAAVDGDPRRAGACRSLRRNATGRDEKVRDRFVRSEGQRARTGTDGRAVAHGRLVAVFGHVRQRSAIEERHVQRTVQAPGQAVDGRSVPRPSVPQSSIVGSHETISVRADQQHFPDGTRE